MVIYRKLLPRTKERGVFYLSLKISSLNRLASYDEYPPCVSVNKHLFSFDLTSLRLDFCVVLSHKHSFSITYRTMDVSLQQDWSPGLNCVIISWDGVWPELPCHFVTGFSCKSPTLKHRHSCRACVYKPFINSKPCL